MATLTTAGLTEMFDLLTHRHRRYVLYYLTRESDVVDITTLSTVIAEWEGADTGMDGATSIEAVETGLHHTHLPKLAAAGFIRIDANEESIELTDPAGLDRYLKDTAPIDGYSEITSDD